MRVCIFREEPCPASNLGHVNDIATVDLAILVAVGRASLANQDLDGAGVLVQQEFTLSFEAYAQALERLRDFGWLVVDIRRDGAGRFSLLLSNG